ncbi:MAG: type II CAAX prenyl endopeptidase Rce1 family protein [Planctomycetota bacterium]
MARTQAATTYWRASRHAAVSYVFLIPLLAIYELGVLLDASALNGADYMFKSFFQVFGQWGIVIMNLLFLALLFFSLPQAVKVRRGRPGIYWTMAGEAAAWAAILFSLALVLRPALLRLSLSPLLQNIVASAGAGVYEEVVFRFLLLGGILLLLRTALGAPGSVAMPVAVGISALLFSEAHHRIGGEARSAAVFWFRAAMGAGLGALYLARGLGIVAYTHALYNVFVALVVRYVAG